MQHHISETASQVTKVSLGGGAVAGGTYASSAEIIQQVSHTLTVTEIQAYATLIAAIFTGLYFLAAFILTSIKVVKELKGKKT